MDETSTPASPQPATLRAPVILSYATGQPWWQNRAARKAVGVILLVVSATLAWHYLPRAVTFARVWYWERQCMNFDPPPSTVVFERLPAGSPNPSVPPGYINGDDIRKDPGWASWPSKKSVFERRTGSVYVNRVPGCWLRFLQASHQFPNTIWGEPQNVLFCHELRDPGGNSRLVTVSLDSFAEIGDLLPVQLIPDVYASPTSGGAAYPSRGRGWNYSGQAMPFPCRFFAGQTDSAAASHFTIEYEWPDGVHGFVDGYLRANNHVDVAVRPGSGDGESARRSWEKNPKAWKEKP
jgi:hypothetical protein